MTSKNLFLILSQSKYLPELNQHCPLTKLYIQRTNLKITWPTLTSLLEPFLLVVSLYGWLSLPCILWILFLFFRFLALSYYFLMSYLSAGFVSGVYRSCKVTILFWRRIGGPRVVSNGPSVLCIQSSLVSEFLQYFRDRVSLRVTGQY